MARRVVVPVLELLDQDLVELLEFLARDKREHEVGGGRQTEGLGRVSQVDVAVAVAGSSSLGSGDDRHVELDGQAAKLLGDRLDVRVAVDVGVVLDAAGSADVDVVDVDDVGREVLLELQLVDQVAEVGRAGRRRRVLLDDQLAGSLALDPRDLLVVHVAGHGLELVHRDVEQVGVDALGDPLLGHLHGDVQHVLAVEHVAGGGVTHEQRLTYAGAGQGHVECLAWQTTLCDGVEVLEVERNADFLAVVEVVSGLGVVEEAVADVRVEADRQRVVQDLWDRSLAELLVLAVDDLDRLHDGVVDRLLLAELLGLLYDPVELSVWVVVQVLDGGLNGLERRLVETVDGLEVDGERLLGGEAVVLVDVPLDKAEQGSIGLIGEVLILQEWDDLAAVVLPVDEIAEDDVLKRHVTSKFVDLFG